MYIKRNIAILAPRSVDIGYTRPRPRAEHHETSDRRDVIVTMTAEYPAYSPTQAVSPERHYFNDLRPHTHLDPATHRARMQSSLCTRIIIRTHRPDRLAVRSTAVSVCRDYVCGRKNHSTGTPTIFARIRRRVALASSVIVQSDPMTSHSTGMACIYLSDVHGLATDGCRQ